MVDEQVIAESLLWVNISWLRCPVEILSLYSRGLGNGDVKDLDWEVVPVGACAKV